MAVSAVGAAATAAVAATATARLHLYRYNYIFRNLTFLPPLFLSTSFASRPVWNTNTPELPGDYLKSLTYLSTYHYGRAIDVGGGGQETTTTEATKA